jgi:hypothetical protein
VAENLRVVKPGGVALFTVHGDAYKHRLIGGELEQYAREGIVVRAGTGAGEPWFTTYNPAFVEQSLLGGREVLDKRLYPEGESPPHQDIWIVRA